MKKKALVAAILAATAMSATTAFAATNPFKDLPKDHWAYDAVTMLANDGVLEGYSDGNFNGDKLMNRYEMAEIVSKAMAKYDSAKPADKGAIKKLEKEFASELKDMDVRLTQVESDVAELKKKQSSFIWYGDARLRYFKNKSQKLTNNPSSEAWRKGSGREFEKRVRLGIYGEPAKNLSIDGRLKYEDSLLKHDGWGGNYQNKWHDDSNNHESFRLDKFSLNWNHANTKLSAGRIETSLGQGLLYWENPLDGIEIAHQFGPKVNAMIGVGDISAANWSDSNVVASFGNVAVQASPATRFTAAYLHTNTTPQTYTWESNNSANGWWQDQTYKLNQIAVGVNTQLTSKWNLIAEGVRNNTAIIDHKDGLWTRLTYGKQVWSKANTWHVYGEYFALGGGSVDSAGWQHRLNIAGGNAKDVGFANDAGTRGWGLGASYMLAANTNFELTFYKVKPYDANKAGFTKYEDIGYAALTYSF